MIYDRIVQLKDKADISFADISRGTGISKGNFKSWENSKSLPSSEAIIKLSNFFNVSTDYLLKGEEEQINNNVTITSKYNLSEYEILEYFDKLSDTEKLKLLGLLFNKISVSDETSSTLESKSKLLQSKNLKNINKSKNEVITTTKVV